MTFTSTQLRAMAEKYEKDAAWYNDRAKAIAAGQANDTAKALRQAASDRELLGSIFKAYDGEGASTITWAAELSKAIDQARQESRHG